METVLLARAPVHISLGGDRSELTTCDKLVIGATISYYVYVILTPSQLDGIQVIFADRQVLSDHTSSKSAECDPPRGG